ncbi:MAG: Rad52/Rad22 family DNA repair protein [Gemmataceae bacterium]
MNAKAAEAELDLKKLAEPFAREDIEWRIGRSGKTEKGFWATALAYLTNRAIMQRLDDVCGPQRWRNEYREWQVGDKFGVLCGISIKVGDEWVTKWDGAENTDIESIKGGLSDSMKRAAVQWGVGRYLYDLDETFVECVAMKKPGYNFAKSKDGTFYWKTPELPNWALPHAANTNGTGKDAGSQPSLQLVKEMLVGCVNESRLNTVYHRARKWPWTSTELGEINETYLNEFSRITGWVLRENTFHDSTGLAVATMVEDLSGGISIRRSIRVPTVMAG